MKLLLRLLKCLIFDQTRIRMFLLELIQRAFTDDSEERQVLSDVHEFFSTEIVYCPDAPCSVMVELLNYILDLLCNPAEDIENYSAIGLIKPILERISSEKKDGYVKLFNKSMHPSVTVITVVKYLMTESEWNVKMFLGDVIKLVDRINFPLPPPSKAGL